MKNYFLKLYLFECVYKIEHCKAGDSERSFMRRPFESSSRYLLVTCWRWRGMAHSGTLVLHTLPWHCCADSCCSVSETWVRFAVAAVSWASEAWLSFWGPGVWLRWPFVCLHLQLLKIQSGPSSPGLLALLKASWVITLSIHSSKSTCAFNAEVPFLPAWKQWVARTQITVAVQFPQLWEGEAFSIIFIGRIELIQNLASCKTFAIFFSSKLWSLKSLKLCWHCICTSPVHRGEQTPHLTYTCRKKKRQKHSWSLTVLTSTE